MVERFAEGAHLDVVLETGRQHQVRIHLAHIGLPVLGDSRYGRERGKKPGRATLRAHPRRQMLHARRLAFVHPLTGAKVAVESPLPEDFVAVLQSLRKAARARPGRPGPR